MTRKTNTIYLIILISALILGFRGSEREVKLTELSDYYAGGAFCSGNLDKALERINRSDPRAPLFEGMGKHTYPVHTIAPLAQQYFNQGLNLIYAFNHSEAYRSFKECLNIDPYCSMAHWGIAMALGPNINDWIPSKEREQEAYEGLTKAQSMLKPGQELDMVNALLARHSDSSNVKRDSLNLVYRDAMQALVNKYPQDLEIKTLYADAIMNTMPWDYYEKDLTPKPGTIDAVEMLESVIRQNPDHPGAHHLYIHIVEASDNPDRGVPSADHLGKLVPAAGHLVHMPAHIYARVGRYEDAAESNRQAIHADEEYIASCQAEGLYPLGYYPHNIHFLWMAATLNGRMEEALDAAEKTADKIPMTSTDPGSQNFMSVPLQAYVRFGKWNAVLTTPKPDSSLTMVNGYWHYARAIAFTKKGLLEKSQSEIDALVQLIETSNDAMLPDTIPEAEKDTTPDMFAIMIADMNDIMQLVPQAELAFAKGDHQTAIEKLKTAIAKEDNLPYNEPPNWHHPVRQILGNIYIKTNQYAEAEKVFREDLAKFRDNGWSLFGLYQALEMAGKRAEAADIYAAYKKAWENADFELEAAAF